MKIVIVGAGPTGLGAAWRLETQGHADWVVLEATGEAGGLAGSVTDEKGFTWDLGGHVLFSHYDTFDKLMDELVPVWVDHVRESWVWMRGRFIPYPLQNNIRHLPADELTACLDGLLDLWNLSRRAPANFGEWLSSLFGPGLCQTFMRPYNEKVWAYPPEELDAGWMGERVATVDLRRVLRNIVHAKDDVSWGPNARFRFPKTGGTGAIWRTLAARLPREKIRFHAPVVGVDTKARRVTVSSGESFPYDKLISSIPLDLLLEMSDLPWKEKAASFKYSSTHVVGVGVEGPLPASLRTKNWIYFPEPGQPFYRGTVFSNYSPENVPDIARHHSFLCEVSESSWKKVDHATVVAESVRGLERAEMLPRNAKIVSLWHRRLEHGYPTPFLGRDALLAPIDAALRERGIFSRGRFGAWKYEVSNQDHSMMQGVEAVDHILRGAEEETYFHPARVNR